MHSNQFHSYYTRVRTQVVRYSNCNLSQTEQKNKERRREPKTSTIYPVRKFYSAYWQSLFDPPVGDDMQYLRMVKTPARQALHGNGIVAGNFKRDIFCASGNDAGTGLVQQTDQIVAAHDLSLFVGRRVVIRRFRAFLV